MARDKHERSYSAQRPAARGKHPYAAVEHRVLDSPAYADLGFSAQALLVVLCRQLTKDNNGHLQATHSYCSRFGFGSEHTLKQAIASLITHGLIYRTRSHGANGAWARYAVTWLRIVKREGLYLDGFKQDAWKDWRQPDKKSSPQKVQEHSRKKCSFTHEFPAESAGTHPAKTAVYELMPCSAAETALQMEGEVA